LFLRSTVGCPWFGKCFFVSLTSFVIFFGLAYLWVLLPFVYDIGSCFWFPSLSCSVWLTYECPCLRFGIWYCVSFTSLTFLFGLVYLWVHLSLVWDMGSCVIDVARFFRSGLLMSAPVFGLGNVFVSLWRRLLSCSVWCPSVCICRCEEICVAINNIFRWYFDDLKSQMSLNYFSFFISIKVTHIRTAIASRRSTARAICVYGSYRIFMVLELNI
jgi:hypothetical protein